MRNLKVLKNLKQSTGLPNSAIVAAVDGGGVELGEGMTRTIDIELTLKFYSNGQQITEVISLRNVPVYDESKISFPVNLEDFQTVMVEIPNSYGVEICGDYENAILGDLPFLRLMINSTTVGPLIAFEGENTIALNSLDVEQGLFDSKFLLQAAASYIEYIEENTLKLTLRKL